MARQACRKQVRESQPRGSKPQDRDQDSRVIHKQRRCGSMKRMMFLGALVLSVTVCSQSFGFELLDRMLGCKGGSSCCEPACGVGGGCAEPACGIGGGCAEPACGVGAGCCEPACDAGAGCCDAGSCCGTTSRCRGKLFGGLKGLFACKKRHTSCTSCCEPACDAGAGCCEPACDAGAGCCEPACGAAAGCCEPACGADVGCCGVRKKCTPIRDLLASLKKAKRCGASCTSCCEPACDAGAGCCEPGCGIEPGCGCEPACAAAPGCSADAKAPSKVMVVAARVQ
jgi:hypothetical protein